MSSLNNGVTHVADNARTLLPAESLRDELVQHESELRKRLARRAGGYLDRDNVIQQGVLVAYRKLMARANKPARICNLLNFATTVGLRAARAAGRRTRIESLTEYTAFPELFSTPYDLVEAEVEARELAEVLHAAVGQLPAHQKSVIVLRFYEDCSFRQIAETLTITEEAAKMRCARACEQLRPALIRAGYGEKV